MHVSPDTVQHPLPILPFYSSIPPFLVDYCDKMNVAPERVDPSSSQSNKIRGQNSNIDCDTTMNVTPHIEKFQPPSSIKIENNFNENINY